MSWLPIELSCVLWASLWRDSMTNLEIVKMLFRVSSGQIPLEPKSDPDKVYIGTASYVTPEGWQFDVYIDCGWFDYLEAVYDPSRTKLWEWGDDESFLANWRPNQKAEKEIWKIGRQRPYTAEWIDTQYVTGNDPSTGPARFVYKCRRCNAEGSQEIPLDALYVSDITNKFSEEHYSCDPIYGPQIKS